MARWSAYVTDTFFAPEMSKFTSAEIQDMSECDSQQDHWLSNFLLNNIVGGRRYGNPMRQSFFNVLRHTHSAFTDYELARARTLAFLEDREQVRSYVRAIGHWEDFLAHTWQANWLLVRAIGGQLPIPHKLFERGDGSVNERLNALHNSAKHADERIASGKLPGESPLVVWLTNTGLTSTEASLTYGEAADELRGLATWADLIQDPGSLPEKVAALASPERTEGS